jgi:ribosomal protein L39E
MEGEKLSWDVTTYGVMGMLDRIREPSKAGVAAPAFWDGDALLGWVGFEFVLFSSMRRRNWSLFIFFLFPLLFVWRCCVYRGMVIRCDRELPMWVVVKKSCKGSLNVALLG